MIKVTNKMVSGYLSDCLGYDELMIDEIKNSHPCLQKALTDEEIEDCLNYWM